jgi:hypothetical protein
MALPATESFTGADFTFPPNANWSTLDGNIQILSNQADGVAADTNAIYWNADTFANDHYSQCKPSGPLDATNLAGPIVRAAALRWYQAAAGGTATIYLQRVDSDETYTTLQPITGLSLTLGTDVIKLTPVGTTMRAYVNGSQVGTDTTDATYASGSAGIVIYNTNAKADDWEGGNIANPIFGYLRPNQLRPRIFAPGLAR